jgi:ABC-2 type transport system permease protein
MRYLGAAVPDSLRYLVRDLFETITLYDNKALSARREKLADGTYRTTLTVALRKLRADSLGTETAIPLRDYIPFAVLGKGDTVLAQRMVLADRDTLTVELVTKTEPLRAGVDPGYLLIDKRPEDNLVKCGKGGATSEGNRPSGGVRINIVGD